MLVRIISGQQRRLSRVFGALAPEVAAPAQAETSIGDQKWSPIFQDPILQLLVAEAALCRAGRGLAIISGVETQHG
jgi:hypothetical protein